jgi:YD repeat-containing protein
MGVVLMLTTYDERDQKASVIDGANKSIAYRYDSVGNRFDLLTNNSTPGKYSYTYDNERAFEFVRGQSQYLINHVRL